MDISSSNPPSDKGTGNALPPMPKADGDASEKDNLPPVPQLQQPPTPNLPPIPVNENDSRDVKKPSIENQDPESTIKQASLIIPTTSLLSTLNIKLSKILSLIVILFGCYKLYQPFFAVRKPSVPLTTPFILDATASSLVFVYCLRNGFDISTYAELALFATTGIYIVLADWEFSINHDASKLRVMSVVFTLAIMTGMYALLPALLSECSPFVATGIIYLNRFVVQKRKPDVLPMLLRRGRKGVNLKVNGVVLDFAGLVIVSRVVTTWVEMKADVGVLCYYVVLGCIHIMGDKFFGSEGDGLKGSKMVD
ncbi:hypothetical protein BDR26DRAFT_860360 [Obelidium mucronatum]|nr:hypothetical protein BDR26DRAFT_860360 [Obelidium mucronatum]